MSDPKHSPGAPVDPSERSGDERSEPQGSQADEGDGEESAGRNVDPSERPAE